MSEEQRINALVELKNLVAEIKETNAGLKKSSELDARLTRLQTVFDLFVQKRTGSCQDCSVANTLSKFEIADMHESIETLKVQLKEAIVASQIADQATDNKVAFHTFYWQIVLFILGPLYTSVLAYILYHK